jgi:hypothetical protein
MAAYRGWSGGTDGTSSNTTGTSAAASGGTITTIQNTDFATVVLTDGGSISFSHGIHAKGVGGVCQRVALRLCNFR